MMADVVIISFDFYHANIVELVSMVVVLLISKIDPRNQRDNLRYLKHIYLVRIFLDLQKHLFEIERVLPRRVRIDIKRKGRVLGKLVFVNFFRAHFSDKLSKSFSDFPILEDNYENE
jgi:hypothetical protein